MLNREGEQRDGPERAKRVFLSLGECHTRARSSQTLCGLTDVIDPGNRYMDAYLENYVGEWDDECGWHLCIKRLAHNTFLVSLLANGQPIVRPWVGNQPSREMIGTYDPVYGLVVELWDKGKGFSLHLHFEPQFELDDQRRDALTVGLSRCEKDDFLDEYYALLGPLKHYLKAMA